MFELPQLKGIIERTFLLLSDLQDFELGFTATFVRNTNETVQS